MLRVLIPSCTDSLLEACFDSMERMQPGSTRVVIVGDNGLSADFWSAAARVGVPLPFVYSDAINRCAEASGIDDDFLVMGDDTEILTPGWLRRCEEELAAWPSGYGFLNLYEPSTDGGYGRAPVAGIPIETPTVLGFMACLIPRRVWNEIGPMDTRFTGYGYEDFDYCFRLLHAGYKVGVAGCAMVRHTGRGAYARRLGAGMAAGGAANRERFERKWGVAAPEGFPLAAPHYNRQECRCNES